MKIFDKKINKQQKNHKSHLIAKSVTLLTCRVDTASIVIHLWHAGFHERWHHHPARIKPKNMRGIVSPLGVA